MSSVYLLISYPTPVLYNLSIKAKQRSFSLNGLEATKQIRALSYQKPILAWSAHSRYTMWEACKEVGMDEYIELDILVSNLIRDIIMGLIKVGVVPF